MVQLKCSLNSFSSQHFLNLSFLKSFTVPIIFFPFAPPQYVKHVRLLHTTTLSAGTCLYLDFEFWADNGLFFNWKPLPVSTVVSNTLLVWYSQSTSKSLLNLMRLYLGKFCFRFICILWCKVVDYINANPSTYMI